MKRTLILLLPLLFAVGCSSESKSVSFVNLKDGQTIKLPFTVKFKVEGMKLVKKNELIDDKGAGHHHLIIDGDAIPHGTIISADKPLKWIHYGGAQTEGELTDKHLSKGKHKLTLQFGDAVHSSYGPTLAKTINITVE